MVWGCIIYSVSTVLSSTVLRVQYFDGSLIYKLPLYPEGGTQLHTLSYYYSQCKYRKKFIRKEQPTIAIQLQQAKGQRL